MSLLVFTKEIFIQNLINIYIFLYIYPKEVRDQPVLHTWSQCQLVIVIEYVKVRAYVCDVN